MAATLSRKAESELARLLEATVELTPCPRLIAE